MLKQPEGTYDLIFRDASSQTISAVEDGARVQKLRGHASDAAFLIEYQEGAQTTEIYTFYKEADGKLRFTNLVSKGGSAMVARSGLLAGSCDHPLDM